jgi:hypothetical protein
VRHDLLLLIITPKYLRAIYYVTRRLEDIKETFLFKKIFASITKGINMFV